MDDLKILFPETKFTTISGDDIMVKPITFAKLGRFTEIIGNLISKGKDKTVNLTEFKSWLTLLQTSQDDVSDLLALILDKNKEEIAALTIGDVIALLRIIVPQNFKGDIKKNLQGLMMEIKSALSGESST